MAEHTVPLEKETGGCTLTVNGNEYTWDEDGSVTDVLYPDALVLLDVPDGGFSIADEAAHEKAAKAAEHEAATRAPDEPQREVGTRAPGLESRAPGGLDLPVAQEQLPERPLGVPAPLNSAKMAPDPATSNITPRPRAGTRSAKK